MILFDIMTEHWGEDADAEADGPAAVAPAEVFEAPPAPEPSSLAIIAQILNKEMHKTHQIPKAAAL